LQFIIGQTILAPSSFVAAADHGNRRRSPAIAGMHSQENKMSRVAALE